MHFYENVGKFVFVLQWNVIHHLISMTSNFRGAVCCGHLQSERARGGTYLADSSLRAARLSVWRSSPLLGAGGRSSWSCSSRLWLGLPPGSLLERKVHPESDGSGGAVLLKSIQVPGKAKKFKKYSTNKSNICSKWQLEAASSHLLAVCTFDIVASSRVQHRDAEILVDLLPNGAAFNLPGREEGGSHEMTVA